MAGALCEDHKPGSILWETVLTNSKTFVFICHLRTKIKERVRTDSVVLKTKWSSHSSSASVEVNKKSGPRIYKSRLK